MWMRIPLFSVCFVLLAGIASANESPFKRKTIQYDDGTEKSCMCGELYKESEAAPQPRSARHASALQYADGEDDEIGLPGFRRRQPALTYPFLHSYRHSNSDGTVEECACTDRVKTFIDDIPKLGKNLRKNQKRHLNARRLSRARRTVKKKTPWEVTSYEDDERQPIKERVEKKEMVKVEGEKKKEETTDGEAAPKKKSKKVKSKGKPRAERDLLF